MASAAEQTRRNAEIAGARAAGESVPSLALRFGLSPSRIKQIVRETHPIPAPVAANAAIARRDEYRELAAELRELARRLPDEQAPAKVGAYRATLDALDRVTAVERALGFLPDDLARIRSERALVEAVFAVFVEHQVPDEARLALIRRLGSEEAA
jgi:DNA-binding transcriptional regulator YdaS (Cro superfamily)